MPNLFSHSRGITVWFEGPKISYVIPMYHGLESVLGSNLEIKIDLSQSDRLRTIYSNISRNPTIDLLHPRPKNRIPLDLRLGHEKLLYKTVLSATEVPLSQQKMPVDESYEDIVYEKAKAYSTLQLR